MNRSLIVDQTAVAIETCQVGVGHLGSQHGQAFVGQVAILHETCVTQQHRLNRQLASMDLYPELPLPRRNGPGGELAVQCSLVGLVFCSCIVLPIGPASPSLDGCFLVRFGPLGLMKTYLPRTQTVRGRGQAGLTLGVATDPDTSLLGVHGCTSQKDVTFLLMDHGGSSGTLFTSPARSPPRRSAD